MIKKHFIHAPSSARLEFSQIDEELVILNLDSGFYFTVSGIGPVIWRLLDLKYTVDAIIQTIVQHYDIEEPIVRTEVEDFIGKLMAEDLLGAAQEVTSLPLEEPAKFDGWSAAYQPVTIMKYNDLLESFALDPPLVIGNV
ncbi:PqqD family protein [Celeribacter baekdonensis]|uniref:PqqD family protein n=1 Tax=Celeribacter baekdonensis TaxID=875171 RepID=UPI003A8FF3D0